MIFIIPLLFLLSLFVSLILFSFKRFSPVPYFPSNMKDMHLIVKALDLKNNQTVIDLGAGDGIVVFEAVKSALEKKLNTQFVAVDINPILILVLHLRRLLHPNKGNITIVRGDFFSLDFSCLIPNPYPLTTIYLYISPWFLDEVAKRILDEFSKARIVSYMYPIKSLKKKERKIYGKHTIFIYE